MKRKRLLLLLIVILLVLPLAIPASAAIPADTYELSWYVFGGGGTVSDAGYTLSGTIGQPVTGVVEDAGYELCSGFWCGAQNFIMNVFLPLLTKQ